jgi:hypothetical protein
MIKNISLHFDKEFFFKLKEDKARREKEGNMELTWETYIAIIFGMTKVKH